MHVRLLSRSAVALVLVASCGGRTLTSDSGTVDGGPSLGGGHGGAGGAGGGIAGSSGGGGPGAGGTLGSGIAGQSGSFGRGGAGATGVGGSAGRGGAGGIAGTGAGGSAGRGGAGGIAGTGVGGSAGRGGAGGIAGTGTGGRGGIGGFAGSGSGGVAGTFVPGGRGGFFGDTAGTGGGGIGGTQTAGRGGVGASGGIGGIGGVGGRGGTAGVGCPTCRAAVLPIPARDVVCDAARNLIYASVAGDDPTYPNTIVVVDPTTASVVSTIPIGSNPGTLALSDDGSTLWVGIEGAHAFRKVTLTATPPVVGALNHLPKGNPSNYLNPGVMAALPGAPLSVVMLMSDYYPYYQASQVAVFDDGVPRPTRVTNMQTPASIVAGPPGLVFGVNTYQSDFFVLRVAASGVTQTQQFGILFGQSYNIVYAGGRVYSSSGEVVDVSNPSSPSRVGGFSYNGWAIAIRDAQTLLMLGTDFSTSSRTVVRVLSTSTLGQLAVAPVPASVVGSGAGSYSRLGYCGGDAVAFIKSDYTGYGPVSQLVVMHDPAFGTPTGGTGGVVGTGGSGGVGGQGGGGGADPCPGCTFSAVDVYGRDMVFDASRNLIYVAADNQAPAHQSSIVTVDVAAAAIASIVPVGNDPQSLGLSDDGSALWVGLAGERRVRRMTPGSTPIPGTAYALPMLLTTAEPASPVAVAVLPGTPGSIAVGVYGTRYGGRGVFILDDGLPRANFIQPPEVGSSFLINGPPGYLLAIGDSNNLVVFRLGVVGATYESYGGLLSSGYESSLVYGNGNAYASNGEVVDLSNPDAPVPAGRFNFSGCQVAIRSANRVLMLCPNPNQVGGPIMRVLDTTTFVSVGSVTLPQALANVPWVEFTYLGGDAVAMLGYYAPLEIMHAPIIGSPP